MYLVGPNPPNMNPTKNLQYGIDFRVQVLSFSESNIMFHDISNCMIESIKFKLFRISGIIT